MKLDCRNLACPEPVLQTKKALEELPDNSVLEVLVNSIASKENVERFAQNGGFTCKVEADGEDTKVVIVKGYECTIATEKSDALSNKVLFIKDDKIGESGLGEMLIVGFLKTILELPKLPKEIICVNKGVMLTTSENEDIINIFKAFEEKGTQIYSCGICLEYYKVDDKLKVGMIGNAYGTVEMLMNSEDVIAL